MKLLWIRKLSAKETKERKPKDCRRRLNARPNVPLGDEIDHYLGQGRGVARVAKVEEKQRIHPIGR